MRESLLWILLQAAAQQRPERTGVFAGSAAQSMSPFKIAASVSETVVASSNARRPASIS